MPDSGEPFRFSGSLGGSSVQGTSLVVGGALGVSEVFGTAVRFRVRLVTAFFALYCFLDGRVGRFALAFFRTAFLTRFAIGTF